jgi:uncharacterized membrane protein YbhN (UPF0104 family)
LLSAEPATGLLVQLFSVALFFVLGRAVGVQLAFLDCLLLVPPALLLSALPVSLAGWGVREGTLAGMFALVGAAPADIVAVSIAYGLTGPSGSSMQRFHFCAASLAQACVTES